MTTPHMVRWQFINQDANMTDYTVGDSSTSTTKYPVFNLLRLGPTAQNVSLVATRFILAYKLTHFGF